MDLQNARFADATIPAPQQESTASVSQRDSQAHYVGMPGNAASQQTQSNAHRLKEIRIQPLDRGFIVTVGCQSMAISSVHELVSKFAAYVMNPEQTTALYEKGNF